MTMQASFVSAILDAQRDVPAGLVNPDGTPATKRFDVYRNNVAVSLGEALANAFPVVQKLVGQEFFKAMAGVYLRQHPPKSPLMMFYGAEMPGFLETFEPVAKLSYLPDVARLELALRHAYHAADAVPLAPETFQTLPPDGLMAARFRFAPAVRLIRSRHPINGIWRFNMEPGAPKPAARGENVLVTRPEFDPDLTTLPPGGGVFTMALMQGKSFGDALEAATAPVPDFDLTATLGVFFTGAALTALIED